MSKKYTSPEHQIRNIMEATKKRDAGVITDYADDAFDALRDIFSVKKKNELVPVKPETTPPAAKPEPETAKPVETPEVKTDVKTKPEVKTDVAPKTRTEVGTPTKTDIVPKAKTDIVPKTKTDLAPKGRGDGPPRVREPSPPSRFRGIGAFGLTPGQEVGISSAGVFGVRDYLHRPDAPAPYLGAAIHTEETADEIRRKIENVARPNSDRNKVMARNESIKKKIIDENAKKKAIIKDAINDKYSKSVEISPEIKSDKLTEASLQEKRGFAGTAVGTTAAGLGATQGSNIEKKLQDMGLQNPESQRTGVDVALDFASMLPVVGAPFSAASAVRSALRGDYVDAVIDAAGMIPGVKWLTTPMKYGGKFLSKTGAAAPVRGVLTGGGVLPREASRVSGGGDIIKTSGSLEGTKTGKTIDKIGDTAEKFATPGNLFQLGQTIEPVAKQAGSFAKDVYDQKIADPNQTTVKKPQTK